MSANKTDTAQILAFVGKDADVSGGRNGLTPNATEAAIQMEEGVVRPITSIKPDTKIFSAFTGHQMPSRIAHLTKGRGMFTAAEQKSPAGRSSVINPFKPR